METISNISVAGKCGLVSRGLKDPVVVIELRSPLTTPGFQPPPRGGGQFVADPPAFSRPLAEGDSSLWHYTPGSTSLCAAGRNLAMYRLYSA